MTKKIDFKVFNGECIWVNVSAAQGIRRRLVWSAKRTCYEDPPSGPMYEARRMARRGAKRLSKAFSSLQAAREWRERRAEHVPPEAPVAIGVSGYTLDQLVLDFKRVPYNQLSEGTRIIYDRVFRAL